MWRVRDLHPRDQLDGLSAHLDSPPTGREYQWCSLTEVP
jgi:hypothetical protein